MSDPYRLRSLPPRHSGQRKSSVLSWRRAWFRLRRDPRVRETALVVFGTIFACQIAFAFSADDGPRPADVRVLEATTSQTLGALVEETYWMSR